MQIVLQSDAAPGDRGLGCADINEGRLQMSRHSMLVRLALVVVGAYAVTGALELAHDQPTVFSDPVDYVIEAAFVVALLASVSVLVWLCRAGLSTRPATVGWAVAALGHGALATAALATALAGREALDPLFALGFLAIVAGYLTLAVSDLRNHLVPSRSGIVLVVGFVATAIVDNLVTGGGTLVLAATWAALARLMSLPHTSTHPNRGAAVALDGSR